jgi:hypothetical protein
MSEFNPFEGDEPSEDPGEATPEEVAAVPLMRASDLAEPEPMDEQVPPEPGSETAWERTGRMYATLARLAPYQDLYLNRTPGAVAHAYPRRETSPDELRRILAAHGFPDDVCERYAREREKANAMHAEIADHEAVRDLAVAEAEHTKTKRETQAAFMAAMRKKEKK